MRIIKVLTVGIPDTDYMVRFRVAVGYWFMDICTREGISIIYPLRVLGDSLPAIKG